MGHWCKTCPNVPRYYELQWNHANFSVQVAKDRLPFLMPQEFRFVAVFDAAAITSQQDANDFPYELQWSEEHGVYQNIDLQVFVDAGTVDCQGDGTCTAAFCFELGDQYPAVKRYRPNGTKLIDTEGTTFVDCASVRDRYHRTLQEALHLCTESFSRT